MSTEHNELYDYDIVNDTDEIRNTVAESVAGDLHIITVTGITDAVATRTVNLINGDTVDIW